MEGLKAKHLEIYVRIYAYSFHYKQILHFNTTEVSGKPLTCEPIDQAG